MAPPLRIIMLGTGDFALPTFNLLAETGHRIVALVTQPDRPQGRKQELIPSAIKRSAAARGIRVEQPEDVNVPASVERIRELAPDLLVTAAYGQILSAELLAVAPMGGINLHGSILPAYRGAAPVARAIQNGEAETGVTVILMTPRIDAGGMLAFARTPIDPAETAGELEHRLAVMGAPLVVQAIADLAAGKARVMPQARSRVTRAPKLRKEDGLIAWDRPARAIHDLVRAMKPWPTASTSIRLPGQPGREPIRLIVHKTEVVEDRANPGVPPGTVLEAAGDRLLVAAGAGTIRLVSVQVPGKKAMTSAEFLHGNRLAPGDRLGDSPSV
jgi:methionyl-tRNA formyltransferase